MRAGGHENCPVLTTDLPTMVWQRWPCSGAGSVHWGHAFPSEGLREEDGVARGLADVRVVQEAVNGRCREGFRYELVEAKGKFLVRSSEACL